MKSSHLLIQQETIVINFLALLFGLPFAIIGLFVIVKVLFLPMQAPADQTNRIAHLRLVWWAINRPERFVDLYPWLTRDEDENIK